MNEFVTFEFLGSFPGMVAVLGLFVQATKGLIKQRFTDDMAVRWYAFVWALIIVSITYWCQGIYDGLIAREMAMAGLLTFVNAIVVALSAFGGYEVVAHKKPDD